MVSTPLAFSLALVALLAVPATADGPYAITRWTVDGGGVSFVHGGTFVLGGTIGQPDAGRLDSRSYVVTGGFWQAGGPPAVDVPADPPPAPALRDEILPTAPNPFSARTRIAFGLAAPGVVDVRVFDIRGRLVRTLASGTLPAGAHACVWDARNDAGLPQPPGVYLLQVRIPARTDVQKLVLFR